jgi:hypothetical protein
MVKLATDRQAAQEITEEEQERANGNILTLVGFAPIGAYNEVRQFYKEVDFYQLDIQILKKDRWLQDIMAENLDQRLAFALDEENRVIRVPREHKYFGNDFMFLPKRLLKQRYYRVTLQEIEQLSNETIDLEPMGYLWQDRIEGENPTLELLSKAGIKSATHRVLPNEERMARSTTNNDPHNTVDFEEFYKPAHCKLWDCEIHKPFMTFLEAWWAQKKRSPRDVLVGTQVDSREAKHVDFLLYTLPRVQLMGTNTELISNMSAMATKDYYNDDKTNDEDEEEEEQKE